IVQGDSGSIDFRGLLEKAGLESAALAVLHPPYHDIIKYGGGEDNLCNAPSLGVFIERYGGVVENIGRALKPGGYLELVIGDKYEKGEWIPLGLYLMKETLERGFRLKSICVKNIENTMAKRSRIHLWKYRALKSGFYFFKHEYVMFFQKRA
ncbi:MAG: DNA methyltransferase, partial [Nitrososphaerales archaeon]